MSVEDGVFKHQCILADCETMVEFDDEPWCFTHSPDEGSSLAGWSARQVLTDSVAKQMIANRTRQSNVFDQGDDHG